MQRADGIDDLFETGFESGFPLIKACMIHFFQQLRPLVENQTRSHLSGLSGFVGTKGIMGGGSVLMIFDQYPAAGGPEVHFEKCMQLISGGKDPVLVAKTGLFATQK
jgi:hypothetical protein